ncbi:hypothetical protein OUZ56_004099 [Daphnia magna]|uniref:Uncharacterized protein n=1 Tax=Daphnia magna TaxID=35525 RepID=A0ABQ9YNR7_9CRUS|nr:hypothetical protein OUZ56_004099 [Daphnia magna]
MSEAVKLMCPVNLSRLVLQHQPLERYVTCHFAELEKPKLPCPVEEIGHKRWYGSCQSMAEGCSWSSPNDQMLKREPDNIPDITLTKPV